MDLPPPSRGCADSRPDAKNWAAQSKSQKQENSGNEGAASCLLWAGLWGCSKGTGRSWSRGPRGVHTRPCTGILTGHWGRASRGCALVRATHVGSTGRPHTPFPAKCRPPSPCRAPGRMQRAAHPPLERVCPAPAERPLPQAPVSVPFPRRLPSTCSPGFRRQPHEAPNSLAVGFMKPSLGTWWTEEGAQVQRTPFWGPREPGVRPLPGRLLGLGVASHSWTGGGSAGEGHVRESSPDEARVPQSLPGLRRTPGRPQMESGQEGKHRPRGSS